MRWRAAERAAHQAPPAPAAWDARTLLAHLAAADTETTTEDTES